MARFTLEDFEESEVTTLFEIARMALADAEIFDHVCDLLDISDESMQALREKLRLFLQEES